MENTKEISKNKVTNKTDVHISVKKIYINSNLAKIPPNNKNISKRYIYSNKTNNREIKENILLNPKKTNVKKSIFRKIYGMKTIGKKNTIKADCKNLQSFSNCNTQFNNRTYYCSSSSPLNKNEQFNKNNLNYKKLIYNYCTINFNNRNNLESFKNKNIIKYNKLYNLRQKRNQNIKVNSKTYINPFEKVETKLLKNLKSVYPIKLTKNLNH